MGRVRVKICGLTRPEDAVAAATAGADAIGLVFYRPSSRFVDISSAKNIADLVPPFVQRVGLFVNAPREDVVRLLGEVDLDLLQFHGDEPASYCDSFGRAYIKALAMKPGTDLQALFLSYPRAKGFLLDSYHPAKPGGTGEVFNWEHFPRDAGKPLVLAGGLTAENVRQAIVTCRPYAVDVSGGVESGPGIKSANKIKTFIDQVRSAEVIS